jgi:hypothetical protein
VRAFAWASLCSSRILRNRQSCEPPGCKQSPKVSAAGTAVKFHEDGAYIANPSCRLPKKEVLRDPGLTEGRFALERSAAYLDFCCLHRLPPPEGVGVGAARLRRGQSSLDSIACTREVWVIKYPLAYVRGERADGNSQLKTNAGDKGAVSSAASPPCGIVSHRLTFHTA